MTKDKLFQIADETFSVCKEILVKKNADYATTDDPWKNFMAVQVVGVTPARGILVRMMDKISRLGVLLDKENSVLDESKEDTLNDLINYAVLLKAEIKRQEEQQHLFVSGATAKRLLELRRQIHNKQ